MGLPARQWCKSRQRKGGGAVSPGSPLVLALRMLDKVLKPKEGAGTAEWEDKGRSLADRKAPSLPLPLLHLGRGQQILKEVQVGMGYFPGGQQGVQGGTQGGCTWHAI